MIDAETLLAKINAGEKLEPSELEEVVALLESDYLEGYGRKLSVDDIYSLLLVLGRSHAYQYTTLLESFLNVEDTLTVSLVLDTLCLQWDKLEECVEKLISFALGQSWDEDEDIREEAIKLLGEYLFNLKTNHPKKKATGRSATVLELLISTFDNPENSYFIRKHAYFALCRAAGKTWQEIPSAYATLDFSKDIDTTMIQSLLNNSPY